MGSSVGNRRKVAAAVAPEQTDERTALAVVDIADGNPDVFGRGSFGQFGAPVDAVVFLRAFRRDALRSRGATERAGRVGAGLFVDFVAARRIRRRVTVRVGVDAVVGVRALGEVD